MAKVEVKPTKYLQALDAAVTEDREARSKQPLKPSDREPETKQIKVSRTNKDSCYMIRDGKPKGFFYLDHRTVAGRHAIITDTHVTPANVHDSVPYLGRLQRERFNFSIRACRLRGSGHRQRPGRAQHLRCDRVSQADALRRLLL